MTVQMPLFLLGKIFRKKIIVELHVGNQLNNYINNKEVNWVFRKADKIVVLANVWKNLLIDKYNMSSAKVYVLYNPAPKIKAIAPKHNYFLFMSYLTPIKGYDVVIKAFSLVVQKYRSWKLVIAGAAQMENARQIVKELNVEDQVEFHGWVTGNEKDDLLLHTGGFCMASYMEGFPMSVLEAWSYGAPLLTTPVGGLPDVLKDGFNALVFEFGDYEGLSRLMIRLIESKELQNKLSLNGQRLVLEKLDINVIASDLDRLYQSLF